MADAWSCVFAGSTDEPRRTCSISPTKRPSNAFALIQDGSPYRATGTDAGLDLRFSWLSEFPSQIDCKHRRQATDPNTVCRERRHGIRPPRAGADDDAALPIFREPAEAWRTAGDRFDLLALVIGGRL